MDKGKCYYGKIHESEAPANPVPAHTYRAKGFSEIGVVTIFRLVKQAESRPIQLAFGEAVEFFCSEFQSSLPAVRN